MLLTRNIRRNSPEKIFLVVRNAMGEDLTVGHGAFRHFSHAGSFTRTSWLWNGCDVTATCELWGYGSIPSDIFPFAGVVGPLPIPKGSWGLVQAFGRVDRMIVGSNSTDWITALPYGGGEYFWVPQYSRTRFDDWDTQGFGRGVFALHSMPTTAAFYAPRFAIYAYWVDKVQLVTNVPIQQLARDVYAITGFVRAL